MLSDHVKEIFIKTRINNDILPPHGDPTQMIFFMSTLFLTIIRLCDGGLLIRNGIHPWGSTSDCLASAKCSQRHPTPSGQTKGTLESNTVMSSKLRISHVRICSRRLNKTSMEKPAAGHQGPFPVVSGAGKPPPEVLSLLHPCIIFTLFPTFGLCILKIFCYSDSKDNLEIKT